MNTKQQEVLNFIARFTNYGKSKQVIDTFTCGCCYWFASILMSRFVDMDEWDQDIELMYDQVMNHFGCRIDGCVYDITGDVTGQYNWKPFYELEDEQIIKRIYRDCVNF